MQSVLDNNARLRLCPRDLLLLDMQCFEVIGVRFRWRQDWLIRLVGVKIKGRVKEWQQRRRGRHADRSHFYGITTLKRGRIVECSNEDSVDSRRDGRVGAATLKLQVLRSGGYSMVPWGGARMWRS